jgi:hypothetical protein
MYQMTLRDLAYTYAVLAELKKPTATTKKMLRKLEAELCFQIMGLQRSTTTLIAVDQ